MDTTGRVRLAGLGITAALAVAATPALAVPGDWEGFRGLPDTVLEVGQSSVAAGDGGRGVAVWSAAGPDSGRLTVAVRTPDGRWGPSEVLDAGLPSGGFRPQAAINARGDMAVAWTTGRSPDTADDDGVVVSLRRAGASGWTGPVALPAEVNGPFVGYALAVDGDGVATVLLARLGDTGSASLLALRMDASGECRSTFGARALVNTIATATARRFGRFGPASVVARGPAHGNVLALGADLGGRAVLAWSPSGLSPDGLIAAVRPGTGALRGLTAGIGLRADAWVAAQRGERSMMAASRKGR